MKWFSFSGIIEEIKKIHWPSKKELFTNSVQVVIFTFAFGLFFFVCQLIISELLNLMGAIG